MKKVSFKSWVVLIYVLFLMSIWVAMWLVVFKNSFVYYNNLEYQDIQEVLHSNIYTKTDVAFKLVKTYNSNGWGYSDVMSCPSAIPNRITMSWNTLLTNNIQTTIHYADGVVYCLSDTAHNGSNFRLFFNLAHDDYETAEFKDSYVTLAWSTPMQGTTTFTWADVDFTHISFTTTWISGDGYDDNFNSDYYRVVSTWSAATGTLYPDMIYDDDTYPRRMMFGYLNPSDKFRNIFWNNEEVNNFINDNTNNDDPVFVKLWDVSSGYIILTIDGEIDLKIAKYDRRQYTDDWVLYPLEIVNWKNITWNWYIQINWTKLSTSTTKTWNEYNFDFSNHDYAIFIKNLP